MTPDPLILLQKYRDTNGRRIVIQIGGVYSCIVLSANGRAILFAKTSR